MIGSRLDAPTVARYASHGYTDAQIGQMFGVGRMTVNQFRKKHGIAGRPVGPNAVRESPPAPDVIRVDYRPSPVMPPEEYRPELVIPPAPFAVPIASPARGLPASAVTKAVIYGDTHLPFHDEAALRVVMGIVKDVQPDVLLHDGDLLDCFQISRFDKNPERKNSIQDDIDLARAHLHQMAQIAPNARRVLLEGNHEARLTKVMWGLEGVSRQLAMLRDVREAVKWENLLRLEEIGWEFVAHDKQSKTPILPKLITKHGTVVRKSAGMSARGEWEKYGKSGISGHTHRLSAWRHKDSNGVATWVECGCTCSYEQEYGGDHDWQQGCVVITWTADHRLMDVETVSIRDGTALYRGKEYV